MYDIFEELVKKHGITNYQVSKDVKIPYSVLSDWKSGRSTPKIDKLNKIADYFGVTLDYLFGKETKKEVEPSIEKIATQKRQSNNDKLQLLYEEIEKIDYEDIDVLLVLLKRLNKVK